MRNNGNKAKMVIPADINATVIPRPISDLKNIPIAFPPFIFCLVLLYPINISKVLHLFCKFINTPLHSNHNYIMEL